MTQEAIMQTNPEQWAEDLLTKVREQHPHVAISTLQAAFAEREARLVEAEREAIINWLRGGAGTDTTTLARPMRVLFLRGLHGYADAIERGDHLAALKDRTHG